MEGLLSIMYTGDIRLVRIVCYLKDGVVSVTTLANALQPFETRYVHWFTLFTRQGYGLLSVPSIKKKKMIKVCKSCRKDFQNLTKGVLYSSSARGVLEFCSDDRTKNYLNSVRK